MSQRPHVALAIALTFAVPAAAGESVGWDASRLPVWPSPVAPEAIVVDGPTDIRWTPEAFAFTPGPSRRYIDHAAGDDARDGLTPATAWKHHPWDAAAGGAAAAGGGNHTYIFKRGVVYRGKLVGKESGTAEQPVQLTSDPAWGAGEAVIAGSLAITSGWTKASAADSAAFPEASRSKLWSVALPGAQIPRALWLVGSDGARQRLNLARWPNWTITHRYDETIRGHGWIDLPLGLAPGVADRDGGPVTHGVVDAVAVEVAFARYTEVGGAAVAVDIATSRAVALRHGVGAGWHGRAGTARGRGAAPHRRGGRPRSSAPSDQG